MKKLLIMMTFLGFTACATHQCPMGGCEGGCGGRKTKTCQCDKECCKDKGEKTDKK